MTIVLVALFPLLASVAPGDLAPVGEILLATFLGQIVAAPGYGAYFPWRCPRRVRRHRKRPHRPGPVGYLLVVLVGLAARPGRNPPAPLASV
jgi:ABC-2 type transport system permease protein